MYRMNKLNNNIFPFLNFIFLSEEEKEKYFTKGNIRYFKTNNINNNDFSLNNVMIPLKNCDFNNNIYINNNNKIYLEKNNCISDLNVNSTCDRKSSKFFAQKKIYSKLIIIPYLRMNYIKNSKIQ